MMAKYRWGILGPGSIAKKFAAGLAALPDAVLCAVGSRDAGRARAFADEYGFERAYGSYAELAADADVDAIYVATPHPQHQEAATLCLSAGKAVLCEKPFAPNASQASRMIECAKKHNVFLMEAVWTRFLPSILKTRELIAGGAIGEVLHVNADFAFRAPANPESRLFNPDAAGGSLLDVGVYNLSFCSMLFGRQPDRVQSHLSIGETGVDEFASVILNYKGGQSASLFSALRVGTGQDAAIYGENGYIKLPGYWHGDTVVLYNNEGTKEFKLPFESTGYQFEAAEVMSCLNRGLKESPVMPLRETLEVIKLADRIRFDNNLKYPFES